MKTDGWLSDNGVRASMHVRCVSADAQTLRGYIHCWCGVSGILAVLSEPWPWINLTHLNTVLHSVDYNIHDCTLLVYMYFVISFSWLILNRNQLLLGVRPDVCSLRNRFRPLSIGTTTKVSRYS